MDLDAYPEQPNSHNTEQDRRDEEEGQLDRSEGDCRDRDRGTRLAMPMNLPQPEDP